MCLAVRRNVNVQMILQPIFHRIRMKPHSYYEDANISRLKYYVPGGNSNNLRVPCFGIIKSQYLEAKRDAVADVFFNVS